MAGEVETDLSAATTRAGRVPGASRPRDVHRPLSSQAILADVVAHAHR